MMVPLPERFSTMMFWLSLLQVLRPRGARALTSLAGQEWQLRRAGIVVRLWQQWLDRWDE
jgi:hypothetical protein